MMEDIGDEAIKLLESESPVAESDQDVEELSEIIASIVRRILYEERETYEPNDSNN